MTKEILTASEVGTALGVSAGRIHQLIKGGHIPAIRVGARSVRIPRAAFEQWLQEKNDAARASIGKEAVHAG